MKFITQAAKVLNEQKKYKRRLAVFLCLAVVVALGTAAALKMYGQAMSHKQKKLVCRYAAHAHTDGCFDGEAVVCGYADYAVHLHNDDCYGPNGELVCHLPEAEAHVHTEECYTEQEVLICEEEGAQAHEHTEGCYTPERGDLSCQMEEHMHEDSCYGENGEIICPMEEHQHDDNCYEWKDVLTCTLGGHEHTQDCYTREMRDLSCNLEEHGHGEACYDESGELACQLEEHTHDDNCYVWEDVLTCQLEESDGGHVHGDGCYEMQKVLSCGKLELHTHDDSCCDENGALVCGLLQLEEHVHGEDCFETVELTEEEIIALTGAGEEETVSEDAVSGNASESETTEKEEPATIKTFENDSYIVTAAYHSGANIPEDAELRAELITPENNSEHYAQREAELQEALEDKSIRMDALLKIGFYKADEEIEPESDVTITVQFLDENGLAEGSPITVVHFADGQNQVIGGSDVKDRSTTFKTDGFSEFGFARHKLKKSNEIKDEEAKEGHIPVAQTYEYREDDAYHITFFIEGEAVMPDSDNEAGKIVSFGDVDTITYNDDEDTQSDNSIAAERNIETTDSPEIPDDNSDIENTGEENDTAQKSESADVFPDEEDGNADNEQEVEFKIEPLDEDSEKYAAISAYTDELEITDNLSDMRAFNFALTKDGVELELEHCAVTAQITLTEKSFKNQSGVEVAVLDIADDGEISELDTAALDTQEKTITVALNNNNVALYSTVNTEFTVQYYAQLQVPRTEKQPKPGNGTWNPSVNIIDTSAASNGGTPKLPENSTTPKDIHLYLNKTAIPGAGGPMSDTMFEVEYKDVLHEIYAEETYDISTYPKIENFNKFATDDKHYKLIKILEKVGSGDDSWKEYPVTAELTNNQEVKKQDPDNTILIRKDSIIRLVADPTDGNYGNGATFYDYDITDGFVYSDETLKTPTSRDPAKTLYASINRKGINSKENYTNDTSPRFGFGNLEKAGSGLDADTKNGYKINVANDSSFKKCSFGLVDSNGLDGNGLPVFTVNSPDLFSANDQTTEENGTSKKVAGKTTLADYSLNFNRIGDTYTLFSVKDKTGDDIPQATNLDKFQWRQNWGKTLTIWSNLFWPMDASSATYGTEGHDLKFGLASNSTKRKAVGSNGTTDFNTADEDITDHNSYFGMSFSVTFDLTDLEDYRGPLNYYFFGDDDMWVFLDGEKLICDIGGVHPSVGEYVNIWDYLGEKKTVNGKEVLTLKDGEARKHTLQFFYTERGASGSCCWMQFTLPSVASGPVNQPTGDSKTTLTVGKQVSGEIVDPDASYEFIMNLMDKQGTPLSNYYNYDIIDENNVVVDKGSIKNGDTFRLKHKQSIIVKLLPDGAKYKIKEKPYSGYIANINGEITADGMTEGNIDWSREDEVNYINQEVSYELPETGGSGVLLYTMAGALGIIFGTGFMYRKNLRERRR